jgi:hypothetical protein
VPRNCSSKVGVAGSLRQNIRNRIEPGDRNILYNLGDLNKA